VKNEDGDFTIGRRDCGDFFLSPMLIALMLFVAWILEDPENR